MSREFHVVLMGATGFTGRLAARYLAEFYGNGNSAAVKWAVAGRSEDKLKELLVELVRDFPSENLTNLPYIVADSFDVAALQALARRTKVVMSTVGPFSKYGTALVDACVAEGAHYCDITGETHWVNDMIKRHEKTATDNKLRIVSLCGFDSIPSDLGTRMVVDALKAKYKVGCARVDAYFTTLRGGISGGTIASMVNIFEQPPEEFNRIIKESGSPYGMVPEEARPKHRQPPSGTLWYSSEIGLLTAPFVMASINIKTVHRSSYLLGGYGRQFEYTEQAATPLSLMSLVSTTGTLAMLVGLSVGLYFTTIRNFIKGYLPQPGDGPTVEQQIKGKSKLLLVAKGEPLPDGSVPKVLGIVTTDRDPSYSATARMLVESGLCLALDDDKLPAKYGFLTPASFGGTVLMERLKKSGMTFDVLSTSDPLSIPTSRL